MDLKLPTQIQTYNQQQSMISAVLEEQRQPSVQEWQFGAEPKDSRKKSRRYGWQLAAVLIGALLLFIFYTTRHIRVLEDTVTKLEAKLVETQKNSALFNSKEIEMQRMLIKTQLKINNCFKKVVQLKKDLNTIELEQPPSQLPRILWLFSEHKLSAQKMVEQFLGSNLAKIAKNSNLEVRMTNSWEAYDWLSAKTTSKITKTMQNMRIDQKVNELLKIALLMEHGGILVSVSEILLAGNLSWVYHHFSQTPSPEVLLFTESSFDDSREVYQDYFMAAVPKADLIVEIFDTLCNTITLTSIKYPELKKAAYIDSEMNVTVVPNIIKNTINGVLNLLKPEIYSVATIHLDVSQRLSASCQKNLFSLMKQPKQVFGETCGKNDYFFRVYQRSRLEDEMEQAMDPVDDSARSVPSDSYWHQLLDLSTNLKYFIPVQPREVNYCVLDVNSDQNVALMQESFENLKKQSYGKWKAVYFVDEVTAEMDRFTAEQNRQQQKITIVKSSNNLGRNYELGIIKHCPQKSFIVILKRQDTFQNTQALQLLSKTLSQHRVLGAYVSVNVSGKINQPTKTYPNYTKLTMNGRQPQYPELNSILNFLKVFHSDCYKILPQFSHYTSEGQYYTDRFKFLQAFVQMVMNATKKHDDTEIEHTQRTKWLIKSSSDLFDSPNRIEIVKDVVINTDQWEEVNRTEIAMNNFKSDVYPMTYTLDHLLQNGQNMADFAIYNKAEEIEPYTKRNKPDIIPKVFHLIWIEGEMPQPKRKVLELNQEMYPDFQIKIWSKDNITRQNFPLSYDLLLNIYACNKFTRFSKMATMADVMRHQILYYQGGIYMDTSMLIYKPTIYKWLSYKLFLSTEHIFRHRWNQNMCIFATAPRYPGLLRIIQHTNTNRYNILLRDALEIAGPGDFRHLIQGYEEYDKDILILDFDGFYPFTYAKDNYQQAYCLTQPNNLKHDEEIYYKFRDLVLIKNCAKYYPYSFGKELNILGTSWQRPRWLT